MAPGRIVIASLVGCGPGDQGSDSGYSPWQGVPDLDVTPRSLEFGELRSGDRETRRVTLTNVGSASLHVAGAVIAVNDLAFSTPGAALDLEPGATGEVEVTFSPDRPEENYGQLVILSDAASEWAATVSMLGFGAAPALRLLAPFPGLEAGVPCPVDGAVTVQNVGADVLVVEGVELRGDDAFGVVPPALPLALAPGAEALVRIRLTPDTAGAVTADLVVRSTDPEGDHVLTLAGTGSWVAEASEAFVVAGSSDLVLAEAPWPDSVRVAVDGVATSDVTVRGRVVTVRSPALLDGDLVQIDYALPARCP